MAGGWGYFRITLDYAHEDRSTWTSAIERVPIRSRIYGDPLARPPADSSDWNSAFVVEKMDKDSFRTRPTKAPRRVDWDAYSGIKDSDWFNGDEVMIAE